MPDHNYFASLIWQIADLRRGPNRPPQYERVRLPMTVRRRFDCVLASSKPMVLAEHARLSGGSVEETGELGGGVELGAGEEVVRARRWIGLVWDQRKWP